MSAPIRCNRFSDIPQFTREPGYRVNMMWDHVEQWLDGIPNTGLGMTLEICPDFQRGHVWTEAQQIAYVEFRLRGGKTGREIVWNHPRWNSGYTGALQLVDGLQRLTAVRRFMANEIPAFGTLLNDYADKMPWMDYDFIFYVNDLKTRAEVLTWYLEINSGGTPHTEAELERVRGLLTEAA